MEGYLKDSAASELYSHRPFLVFFIYFFLGKLAFSARKGYTCIISHQRGFRKGSLTYCQKIICVAHHSKKVRGEELLLPQLYDWGNGMKKARKAQGHIESL